jgi:hypothetical protein
MVKVSPKAGLFNHKCHCNTVEYARTHKGMEVLEVIYIDGTEPFLHYINRKTKTGELLETTLGFEADRMEYYIIRTIHPEDHKHIGAEFSRSLNSWLMDYTSWFDRAILRVDRVV